MKLERQKIDAAKVVRTLPGFKRSCDFRTWELVIMKQDVIMPVLTAHKHPL